MLCLVAQLPGPDQIVNLLISSDYPQNKVVVSLVPVKHALADHELIGIVCMGMASLVHGLRQ